MNKIKILIKTENLKRNYRFEKYNNLNETFTRKIERQI